MIKKILVYISDKCNPYENLAKEKILFDSVKDDEMILYLWQNENTVVIGRNQNAYMECRFNLLYEEGGYLARRLSGGGAVFHDLGNLNFTFISSSDNQSIQNNLQIISLACKMSGIETEVSGRNDLLANGRKFSGNAFYNSKGKSYHHGTILINTNKNKLSRYLTPPKAKLEAKGIKSVRSRIINLNELTPDLSCDIMRENLEKAFEEFYGIKIDYIKDLDSQKIKTLSEKYSSRNYLFGNELPFDFEFSDRFDWGSISINLSVEKGIIKNAMVYSDSMDWTIDKKIKNALINCHMQIKDMEYALLCELEPDIAKDIITLIKKML